MSKHTLSVDPRGLIYEAYRMEIGPAEARAIFLDWAVGLERAVNTEDVAVLLGHYGAASPDHPMTAVLREGLETPPSPPRRRRRTAP